MRAWAEPALARTRAFRAGPTVPGGPAPFSPAGAGLLPAQARLRPVPAACCSSGRGLHGGSGSWGQDAGMAGWLRTGSPLLGGLGALAAGMWLTERVGMQSQRQSCRSSAAGGVTNEDLATAVPGATAANGAEAAGGPSGEGSAPAGGAGDSDRATPAPLLLESGAWMLPHPDKVDKGGEDAYFIASNERVLGVADGVGGWADVGVDAGEYSRMLMRFADTEAGKGPFDATAPARILQHAYENTQVQGSCTACVLVLEGETLHAANLGDSGFIVVRTGNVLAQSPPQQHGFNFPFQMGSEGSASDPPSAAQAFKVTLKPDDIVVLATDGMLDNVFPDEAATIATVAFNKGQPPHVAAQAIASFAQMRAGDRKHMSPFAYAAQAMGYYYLGGKMDDITVLVSYVKAGDKPTATATDEGSKEQGGGGEGDAGTPAAKL